MKAFMVNRYSKKDDLHLVEIPEPAIMKNEVLIQVYAAAINQLDSKIKNGEFKLILPYKTPFVLGHDAAGVVVKAGAEVLKFKVGDEVYARPLHLSIFLRN
ncbi:MAG: alcohol dehydrogenase catalytic domain-containing protein [Flavisolibacter sp.]|jgi:NADPH:quinone reductase-like Zn-dependent oxidoreductase